MKKLEKDGRPGDGERGWIVRGVAMGMMPLQAAAPADIPTPIVAQATAMLQVIRNPAGSFGIALTTVFMTRRISVYILDHSMNGLPFMHAIDDAFLLNVPFFCSRSSPNC